MSNMGGDTSGSECLIRELNTDVCAIIQNVALQFLFYFSPCCVAFILFLVFLGKEPRYLEARCLRNLSPAICHLTETRLFSISFI